MSAQLYSRHIERLHNIYSAALQELTAQGTATESVLIHSGSEHCYFGDDRHIPFEPYGHFSHWLPVRRPDQFVWFSPGQRPIYYQVVPDDFWYDQSIANEQWWADQFQTVRLGSTSELGRYLEDATMAYLGPEEDFAEHLDIGKSLINPPALSYYLDFHRAVKSGYEIEQLRLANRHALDGHQAAQQCFLNGGSEYHIHMAYLEACRIIELDSPYTNIVAIDEKAAILHYQHKRHDSAENSHVLLIDAGYRVNNYCADITRTTVKDSAHSVFKSVLKAMDGMQQSLVAMVRPDLEYKDLHEAALTGVADILLQQGICRGSRQSLMENKIPQLFMPHGVGHLLGIQVHDVGGHQKDSSGATRKPPEESPSLRNTRMIDKDMVFTIEPGLYFIPMLLDAEHNGPKAEFINYDLVNELYPYGGIRIEDNVRVLADGSENLTRAAL